MENYKISINNIDEYNEIGRLYEIKFTNNDGIKLAIFEFDIDEINLNLNSSISFKNIHFKKLSFYDKINIFNQFVFDLTNKTYAELNFLMTNGEKSIIFKDEYIKFKISSMTMKCEFIVKITNNLKNEFEKILNLLLEN